MTAGGAVLAALLGHEDYEGLMRFIRGYRSNVYLPLLEMAAYTVIHRPGAESSAKFSYELNGETVDVDFGRTAAEYIELGKAQLAESDFKAVEGEVGYTAYYYGEPDEGDDPIEGVNVKALSLPADIRVGDAVKFRTEIDFSADADAGYFSIIQSVPSGLRFTGARLVSYDGVDIQSSPYSLPYITSMGVTGYIRFNYYTDDYGLVHFNIGPSPFDKDVMKDIVIEYEARAVLTGDYVSEGAAYGYDDSDELYKGEDSIIRIGR
jgi:hypothetical protein